MLMRTAVIAGSQDLPVDEVLAEVERFCTDGLAPVVARHECTASLEHLQSVHSTLAQIGVLAEDADGSGLGLWEAPDTAAGRGLSLAILRLIARHNMGVAWSLHQRAVARLLERRLSLSPTPRPHTALQGRYGLCRGALAARLCGRALDAADTEILHDYFDAEREPGLLIQTLDDWQTLWMVRPRGDSLQWQCWSRDGLLVERLAHPHGLDELALCAVTHVPGSEPGHSSALDARESHALMTELLTLTALAQLAIAAGGVEHARGLATAYAAQRRQGGVLIGRHAAVRLLLASAAEAEVLGNATLGELAVLDPRSASSLARIFRARAGLQPRFCQAASDALQVFGGMGYMKDAGMEKILRDQNMLRVIHGTPVELHLAADALDEALS